MSKYYISETSVDNVDQLYYLNEKELDKKHIYIYPLHMSYNNRVSLNLRLRHSMRDKLYSLATDINILLSYMDVPVSLLLYDIIELVRKTIIKTTNKPLKNSEINYLIKCAFEDLDNFTNIAGDHKITKLLSIIYDEPFDIDILSGNSKKSGNAIAVYPVSRLSDVGLYEAILFDTGAAFALDACPKTNNEKISSTDTIIFGYTQYLIERDIKLGAADILKCSVNDIEILPPFSIV